MATDRMGERLADLGPESRALVELSVVRGIPDEELAGMLGVSAGRVRERRADALAELGATSEEEQAGLAAALRGERHGEAAAEPPAPQPAGVRRRATRLALLGGLLIAVVVAGALALGDGEPAPAPDAELVPPGTGGARPARSEQSEPAPLTALGGGSASGSAEIVGGAGARRLRLIVRGLPEPQRGGYVVWLYNSIAEARPLTGARKGSFAIQEPLPAGASRRFRFVDVSREPADGNPNHSGASILRVSIDRIPEG